jgi:carboxymethylenebutenolidase
MALSTSTIDVPTPDGTADAFVAHPDDGQPHPGVLYYMDAFGLRKQVFDMCARIAEAGYFVVAPNVFYRDGRAPLVADLPDLMKSGNREQLFSVLRPFMSHVTPDGAMRDAGAYLDFLAGHEAVADGPVGATGYCMGGRLALRTAGTFPDRVAAAASFHGGNLANDAEDSPHLLAGTITAEVYVGHADNDRSAPPEQQERLAEALSAAGVSFKAELYDGAAHGFTQADTAAYDEQATNRHWEVLLDLFARNLEG